MLATTLYIYIYIYIYIYMQSTFTLRVSPRFNANETYMIFMDLFFSLNPTIY